MTTTPGSSPLGTTPQVKTPPLTMRAVYGLPEPIGARIARITEQEKMIEFYNELVRIMDEIPSVTTSSLESIIQACNDEETQILWLTALLEVDDQASKRLAAIQETIRLRQEKERETSELMAIHRSAALEAAQTKSE